MPFDLDVAQKTAAPGSELFREAALAAYDREDDASPALVATPPSMYALFGMMAAVVLAALGLSIFQFAEITSRGRGILRTEGGVQPISVQGGGVVAEVYVKSGDSVRAGDLLLSLDSAIVKADLLQADRRLELAQARSKDFEGKRKGIYATKKSLLQSREELLRARVEVQEATIARGGARLDRATALLDAGLVTPDERDLAANELSQATQTKLSLAEELASVRGQISGLDADLDLEAWTLRTEIDAAQAKRDALVFAMTQTAVSAPSSGRLEAVLVRRGDTVAVGGIVGKLVQDGEPVKVISFVPERDRAFLAVGAPARIELDQLPVSEFGPLQGKITRIGVDVASTTELREALGDYTAIEEPRVRVEVTLEETPRTQELARYLRAGSLLDVRYTLRRRRVITLMLEPLRRWLHDR